MTPAPNYLTSRLYSLFPHPAQDASEKRRYIAMLTSRYVLTLYYGDDTYSYLLAMPTSLVR